MADVAQAIELKNGGRKRKPGNKKGKMAKKRQRIMPQGTEKRVKVDQKMKKLYQKRARDYNSDDEDEGGKLQKSSRASGGKRFEKKDRPIGNNRFKNNDRSIGDDRFKKNDRSTGDNRFKKNDRAIGANRFKRNDDEFEGGFSDEGEEDDPGFVAEDVSEDEDGGIQPGITRFSEGIKAFRLAFKKIVKKSGGDEDVLGPVLSAHKKLIAEKLAEEEAEKKVKGEVKKEKHLIGEKGHVKPANYLDAHEKLLLGVATKGVVKLFNAVNKAQNAQKGLNPSRTKDEKVIKKRRKEAFFSELGSQSARTVVKVGTSVDGEAPGWAPLRDNYMLTNPKLKDWDKMQQDTNVADDFGRQSDSNSSSDED